MKISFIGLGKLGLPIACCLARYHDVLGVDKNELVLHKLSCGELPFHEPGLLEEFQSRGKYRMEFTDSYHEAVTHAEAVVILVNTQLGEDGYSSELVENVIDDLALNFRNVDKEKFTIVLSSTVLPGTCARLITRFEQVSGKKFGEDFGFAYVPDFVRLGEVIKDTRNPEFFLYGVESKQDMTVVDDMFSCVHENNPRTFVLNYEEAEVAKLSLNAYIVMKITFANFLASVCSNMNANKNVDVNVHRITNAIGHDKRISPHFFDAGPPYGGTCFPRDTSAFIRFAKDYDHDAKHLRFAEEVNEMTYRKIFDEARQYARVGIAGMSFKAGSPVLTGSPSMRLMHDLVKEDCRVVVFDDSKQVLDEIMHIGHGAVSVALSRGVLYDLSDVIILMHKHLAPVVYQFKIDDRPVIDPWGCMYA